METSKESQTTPTLPSDSKSTTPTLPSDSKSTTPTLPSDSKSTTPTPIPNTEQHQQTNSTSTPQTNTTPTLQQPMTSDHSTDLGNILPRIKTPELDKAVGDFTVGTAVSAITGSIGVGSAAGGLNKMADTLIDKHVPTEKLGEKIVDAVAVSGGISREFNESDGGKTVITTGASASGNPFIATFGADGKMKDLK